MNEYPTCLLGYVKGRIRYETTTGKETYAGEDDWLINVKQTSYGGDTWAITHLQKRSKYGFLLMWPFCLHLWWTFKYQEQEQDGTWIPGTEKVLYVRSPGYRWEAGSGSYIHTKGYAGLRLD